MWAAKGITRTGRRVKRNIRDRDRNALALPERPDFDRQLSQRHEAIARSEGSSNRRDSGKIQW